MANNIEFSLNGADEIMGKIREVKSDVAKRGGRAALRKAAQVVEQALKTNAQALDDIGTGRSIADNVALRWNGRLNKSTGDLGFRIGIMGTAKTARRGEKVELGTGAKTPHWRLLEFGTENMPAKPFARKALAENIALVTNTFITEYNKALDRAIKRAKKAAQK